MVLRNSVIVDNEFRPSFIQMSNHTINSWKKFCLHHMDVIDDLRRRAISNTEKRTAPEDMDVTETEHLLKEAGVDGETVARWVERRVVA